jgi:hypothetical protein
MGLRRMNIVDRTLMRFLKVPMMHPPIAYERLSLPHQEKIHNFHHALLRGQPVRSAGVSADLEVYVRHETALK